MSLTAITHPFLWHETTGQNAGFPSLLSGNQSAITASADQTGLYRTIDLLYKVIDSGATFGFISRNIEIANLLIEAYSKIEHYFGADPYIELRLVTDPEDEDSERVVAYVRTSLSVVNGLELLRQFDEAWFLDAIGSITNKLIIDLAFQ